MSTVEEPADQPAPQRADTSSPETRLANRYGAPKRSFSRRTRTIAASAAIGLSVVVAALMNIPDGDGDVTSKDVGFTVQDDATITVDYQVDKPADATAACALQALNESYAVVGWKTVIIGPGETSTVRQETTLRTDSLSTTGGVNTCWLLDDAGDE